MSVKILLADDSVTIQKVIKITLGNEPFVIADCSSEEKLFESIAQEKPQIIFLDFNLSTTQNGYILCRSILEKYPNIKIVMMYGTFDTVDEVELTKCGAVNKVTKPFDSTKFIQLTRKVAQEVESFVETVQPVKKPELPKSNPISEVSKEVGEILIAKPVAPVVSSTNWDISVPGIIGHADDKEFGEFPPIIENPAHDQEAILTVESEVHGDIVSPAVSHDFQLPTSNDLEYPDIDEIKNSVSIELETAPKSKLISLDDLTDAPKEKFEIETFNEQTDPKILLERLESQIQDEISDKAWNVEEPQGTKNLWDVDEYEEQTTSIDQILEQNKVAEENEKNNVVSLEFAQVKKEEIFPNDFNEDMLKPLDELLASPKQSFPEEVAPEINEVHEVVSPVIQSQDLESVIKEIVKSEIQKYLQEKADKVLWEILPDLTENLVKKELSKISDEVLKKL